MGEEGVARVLVLAVGVQCTPQRLRGPAPELVALVPARVLLPAESRGRDLRRARELLGAALAPLPAAKVIDAFRDAPV